MVQTLTKLYVTCKSILQKKAEFCILYRITILFPNIILFLLQKIASTFDLFHILGWQLTLYNYFRNKSMIS